MKLRSIGQLLIYIGLYLKLDAIGRSSFPRDFVGMLSFIVGAALFLWSILTEKGKNRGN